MQNISIKNYSHFFALNIVVLWGIYNGNLSRSIQGKVQNSLYYLRIKSHYHIFNDISRFGWIIRKNTNFASTSCSKIAKIIKLLYNLAIAISIKEKK